MSGWYVKRNEQRYGPYSSTQLVELAKKGQVLPIDWVARGGSEQWMPASQVKGLFPASEPPPAPPSPAIPPALPASAPAPASGKVLGVVPAFIAPPVIGTTVVIVSGLLASFFCGSVVVILLSLLHNGAAVVCIVLAVRLQRFLFAPFAALLTMTAWGWYCFTALPLALTVPGLLAGVAVGTWALFAFRSPDVKALFGDGNKPGPLDWYSTPALAGAAGGLLVVILGIGGLLYAVAGNKSNTNNLMTAGKSGGPGDRQMNDRQMKSRSGGSKSGRPVLEDLIEIMGKPDETYTGKKYPEMKLHVWKQGADSFDAAVSDSVVGGGENLIVQTYDGLTRKKLDIIRSSYK